MLRRYDLVRDEVDARDYGMELEIEAIVRLPLSVDLRGLCPPVYNQGTQGSCTANAGVAARMMLLENKTLLLSRAFLYYQTRYIEGTINSDSGATLRDTCKAAQTYGICEESYMPYDDKSYRTAPTTQAKENALKYKITSYTRLLSLNDIKVMLAQNKKPVIIGMEVYESMESATVAATGKLPMPKFREQLLGGHAVLIVGYNDVSSRTSSGYFIIRNSWGDAWGDKGYFYMPYEYFKKYTFDYWVFN